MIVAWPGCRLEEDDKIIQQKQWTAQRQILEKTHGKTNSLKCLFASYLTFRRLGGFDTLHAIFDPDEKQYDVGNVYVTELNN